MNHGRGDDRALDDGQIHPLEDISPFDFNPQFFDLQHHTAIYPTSVKHITKLRAFAGKHT